MNAKLLFFFANAKARRAALAVFPSFDDQRGDSFFARARIGFHVDDRGVGHAAIGCLLYTSFAPPSTAATIASV